MAFVTTLAATAVLAGRPWSSIVFDELADPARSSEPAPANEPVPEAESPRLDPADAVISLTHEASGFGGGRAPRYSVTIQGNGTVVWHGTEGVWELGDKQFTIPRAAVARLVAELERVRFFELDDEGRIRGPASEQSFTRCSDSAVTVLEVGTWGASHRIVDHHCDEVPVLTGIERSIEATAGLVELVQGPARRFAHLADRLVGAKRASLGDVYGDLALGMATESRRDWMNLADADTGERILVELESRNDRLVAIRVPLGPLPTLDTLDTAGRGCDARAALEHRWGAAEQVRYLAVWTDSQRGIRASLNEAVCVLAFERFLDVASFAVQAKAAGELVGHPVRDVLAAAGPGASDSYGMVLWTLPGVGAGGGAIAVRADLVDGKATCVAIAGTATEATIAQIGAKLERRAVGGVFTPESDRFTLELGHCERRAVTSP